MVTRGLRSILAKSSSRTKGTNYPDHAGRWMLTQGFTPTPGAEIDEMDAAALTSQLVIGGYYRLCCPRVTPTPGSSSRTSPTQKRQTPYK